MIPQPQWNASSTVALISGGARGIGRGIVRALAASGANVVFGDKDRTGGLETVALCRDLPGSALFCEMDFSEVEAWPQMLTACLNAGWTPTLGVSNVYFSQKIPVEETTMDTYSKAEAVNQRSGFLMASTLAPAFAPSGGTLIFIGSIMSEFGLTNDALYGMTKNALIGLTRSLAVELAPRSITVNCIQPGFIVLDPPAEFRTIMPSELWSEFFLRFRKDIEAVYANYQPLPLAGLPDDIAQMVLFLSSASGRFVTGSTLHVDGGAALSIATPSSYFSEELKRDARSWIASRTPDQPPTT